MTFDCFRVPLVSGAKAPIWTSSVMTLTSKFLVLSFELLVAGLFAN
jgi:hypothetical protein